MLWWITIPKKYISNRNNHVFFLHFHKHYLGIFVENDPGAIRGTSQTKLYNELGVESLRSRWWFRHLFTLYKIKTTTLPPYLNNMLPKVTHHYQTRNSEDFATYQTRTNIFKYSFFPYSVMEWNKFSSSTHNTTYPVFQNHLLKIIQPVSNPVYNIQNYIGLKLLTRLRLGLSHLNHDFKNCINLFMYL